ncbi:MAG: protein DA1 [Candidatus Zixiibacteriota bacterium]|nr:MAG: protein DA1 [candidate division Zixibacteria bacterium]
MKSARYIILAVCLAGFAVIALHAAVKCDICGKGIEGKYITGPDNISYCWDCYTKYPACSVCGKIYKSLITVDDRKVCSDCYASLKKCDICGKAIMGSYSIYPELGIDVCSDCEKTCPRCDACNRPARKLNRIGYAMLCIDCAAKTSRCYSCGDALLGNFKYFENDESKKYCTKCVSDYKSCADCGAPSGPRGQKLDDGRYLCPDCRREAIFNPSLITPVKTDVLAYLSDGLNMGIKHRIEYSVRDKKFLEKKSKGLSEDINGLFYRKDDDFNVYVLYGLRKKDLIWVLAHEITHAWQAENCSDKLTTEEREGFAQWVAYRTARNFGYHQYAENMRAGESIYSSGLNRMIELEKNGGINAVFAYIKAR